MLDPIETLPALAVALKRLLLRPDPTTGRRIRKATLAGRSGVSLSSLYAYLSGTTLPPADRFDDIVTCMPLSRTERAHLQRARNELEVRRGVAAASNGAPRNLPADVPGFVGRRAELGRLDEHGGSVDPAGATVSVISGMAGVGKTALVVHWAHRWAARFPDGQVFVDLRGFGPGRPLTASEALDALLRAVGAPVPAGELDRKVAVLRTATSGRRMLILLDDAADAAQVRPLLPGSPTCAVLVTSRRSLPGLAVRNGARELDLRELSAEQSTCLLRTVIERGVVAEPPCPTHLATLARLCHGLPLALRVVGERLSRGDTTVPDLLDALGHEHRALDALSSLDDEPSRLRSVLLWSHQVLDPVQRLMFRTLGGHGGADVGVAGAAAWAGLPAADTREILEGLVEAHLLERVGTGRYRFHGLVRLLAVERFHAETEARACGCGTPPS